LFALQGRGEDASVLIDNAIATVGTSGELLDTRAVVRLAQGKLPDAEKDLREALRQAKTPDRLFHLAQVYQSAGEKEKSIQVMDEAMRLGLVPEILHPLEHERFKLLLNEHQQKTKKSL